MRALNPPLIGRNTDAKEVLRIWAVNDEAKFFLNPHFEQTIDVYSQMLLELAILITAEMSAAQSVPHESLLARLMDSLLSEGQSTDFSP